MSAKVLSISARMAMDDFTLSLEESLSLSGVTAVFGASGAGKSSLLRLIAGLETPAVGKVSFAGEVWLDSAQKLNLPAWKRPAGYMFQDARLFPHLSVVENLDYAEQRRSSGDGLRRESIIDALDLSALLTRSVTTLSGGERQRVALGRTLMAGPKLLLLDEPLSALDRGRKGEILPYLAALPEKFGIPALLVSHDIDEVAALAEQMLVLAKGKVVDKGTTEEVLTRLDLQPFTGRYEAGVFVSGKVVSHDLEKSLTMIDLEGDQLSVPLMHTVSEGQTAIFRINAKDVAIATEKPSGISIRNILPGKIVALKPEEGTGYVDVMIALKSAMICSRITRASLEDLRLQLEQSVFALIKSVSFERSEA